MTQFKTSASFESCLVLIKTSLKWNIHRHAQFWSKDLLIKDLLLQTPWELAFIYLTRRQRTAIARNSGHFAPVINCQRNLISKMADKNDRSQGKRIPCDF